MPAATIIEAKSPPDDSGKGTEVIVRLARTQGPGAIDGTVAKDSKPIGSEPPGLGVLIVDDNIDLVMMLAGSLRTKGYVVQAAHTGPDGLKLALAWRPDIVILDIGLPGLDGYEIARQLRANPETKGLRLIALTGYGRAEDVVLAKEAGFDGHVAKPHDFKELVELMAIPGRALPPDPS